MDSREYCGVNDEPAWLVCSLSQYSHKKWFHEKSCVCHFPLDLEFKGQGFKDYNPIEKR